MFITESAVSLRSYQREAHERTRALYAVGTNRVLWVMSTGMGKTITFASLPEVFPDLARYGMLVIVHTDELAQQAVDKLAWVNPFAKISLEKANYRADPKADIIVTSRQTCGRKGSSRMKRLLSYKPFGIVVVDEAHRVRPKGQYDTLLGHMGLGADQHGEATLPSSQERLLVGVTATPNRHDGIGLGHFFHEVAVDFGLRYAIEEGYLVDIEAYQIDTGTDIAKVKTRGGDFAVNELEEAVNTDDRNNLIVSAWKQHSGLPAIAFCPTVRHAHDLAACFVAADVRAVAIDGTTPKDVRAERIEGFKDGTYDVLVNCAVLTEGFDAPRAGAILICRPTKSTTLYTQMIGRGTRTLPSDIGNLGTKEERLAAIEASAKPFMQVLDFVDIAGKHNLITVPHLFGLKTKLEGKRMVKQVVRRVEEIIRDKPEREKEIREAGSFEEVEAVARRVDIWQSAQTPPEIKAVSQYRWQSVAEDTYMISPPFQIDGKRHNATIRVEQDLLDNYVATAHLPAIVRTGKETIPSRHLKIGQFGDLRDAIEHADRFLEERFSSAKSLLKHSPTWGKEMATHAQKKLLAKLGVEAKPDMTKGEASGLISLKLAQKRAKK